MDKNKLELVIAEASSIADVLTRLNRAKVGSNYKWFNKLVSEYCIDVTHFKPYGNGLNTSKKLIDEEIFCKDSKISRPTVRRRILIDGLMDYKCQRCSLSEWKELPLSLVLDHINGLRDDNRISNLRWLCPNCNSQTDTFAGRNKNGGHRIINICECGEKILKKSSKCKKCESSTRTRNFKILWPDPQELQQMLWEIPMIKISKNLGVSDVAVNNFCKKHNLVKPPKGFFLKKIK